MDRAKFGVGFGLACAMGAIGLACTDPPATSQPGDEEPMPSLDASAADPDGASPSEAAVEAAVDPPTWQAPTTIAVGDVAQPRLVVGVTGTAYAVWEDTTPDPDVVMFSERPLGGVWTTPVEISGTSTADDAQPRIAVDPAGNLTVTFRRADGDVFDAFAVRRPAGGAWTSPKNISDGVPSDINHTDYPNVKATANGGAIAYWIRQQNDNDPNTFNDPFQLELARMTPGGTWSLPEFVSSHATLSASSPDLEVDANGNAVAIWLRTPAGSETIVQGRLVPATGAPSAIIDLSDGTKDAQTGPRVLIHAGQVSVLWKSNDVGTDAILRERTRPVAGAWASAADWSAIASVTPPIPDINSWDVSQDAAGNAVVLVERDDGTPYSLVSTQRVLGGAWSTVQPVAGPLPGSGPDEHPRVVATSGGGAVALWGQNDGAADPVHTIQVSQRNADGTWSAPEILSSGVYAQGMWAVADPLGNLTGIWCNTTGGKSTERIQSTARLVSGK